MQTATQTRNQTLEAYYPLAQAIAKQMHRRLPPEINLDDLIGAAVGGLVDAVDRYDEVRSAEFERFARFRIRGAVVDSLRRDDWVPRTVRVRARRLENAKITLRRALGVDPTRAEVAAHLEVTPDRLDELRSLSNIAPVVPLDGPDQGHTTDVRSPDVDAEEQATERQLHALAREAVAALPEREGLVIRLYYLEERPLREVGQRLGVSESRACQIATRGIQLLQAMLRPKLSPTRAA